MFAPNIRQESDKREQDGDLWGALQQRLHKRFCLLWVFLFVCFGWRTLNTLAGFKAS